MFQDQRFLLADDQLEQLAQAYLDVPEVTAVELRAAPDNDVNNPAGPQFLVSCSSRKTVDQRRANGTLPLAVETVTDRIDVVIRVDPLELNAAHKIDEPRPFRPGSSTGGTRNNAGTLGAPVSSPGNGDHYMTCGYVVEEAGSAAYRPGARTRGVPRARRGLSAMS